MPYNWKPMLRVFLENTHEENANYFRNYMKNKVDFLGIKTPERRELQRTFFLQFGFPKPDEIEQFINETWSNPYREVHLFAQEAYAKVIKKCPVHHINIIEAMIIGQPWWDTVDYISNDILAPFLKKHPEQRDPLIKKWSASGNIWLIRSCIIFQRKYKQHTDAELLFSLCREFANSKEFFIQKAIGWSLREYGKVDPKSVTAFVQNNQLSPLSEREAMRIILKK